MTELYRIWSEWDIGHEHMVFTNKTLAMNWCRKNEHLKEVFEEGLESVEDCINAGLIGFEKLTLVDK